MSFSSFKTILIRFAEGFRARVRQSITIPMHGGTGTYMTFHRLADTGEHLAIGFGDWQKCERPLVRIHSECLTGDVFGSGKCDCGDQLKEAIRLMQKEGGILLYLRQEGRGIGLYNKLDTYALQAQGLDTYEANRRLGFKDDVRSYEVAAQMLRAIGKTKIELLSNNPLKINGLKKFGIEIELSRATGVFVHAANESYLRAKVEKTHHFIRLPKAIPG